MQTAYSLQQLEAGLRSPTDCNSSCMQQNLNFLYSRHFPKETMQQIKWKSSFFSQVVLYRYMPILSYTQWNEQIHI